MNRRTSEIGFSQRVRLEWLEQVANLVLAGNDKSAINDALQGLLKDKVSVGGQAIRGNREKIITILMKVWFNSPPVLEGLRVRGLELLKVLSPRDCMIVHLGMVMAIYPFWADVAAQVGRLLRLQGTAAAAHVQRRVREQYGERETVSRAARRVLRSFLDWGVLEETGKKGIYRLGSVSTVIDPRVVAWLVEACLRMRAATSAELGDVLESTCLFPFQIARVAADQLVGASTYLDVLRHGLDQQLVLLREAD